MLKRGRVTKVKVLFLVLVFVFNFDLFKFSAAILEKGLLAKFFFGVFIYRDGVEFRYPVIFYCASLVNKGFFYMTGKRTLLTNFLQDIAGNSGWAR